MLRSSLLILVLAVAMSAQAQDALTQLAGTGTQQWSAIGTDPAATACKAGEGVYTFQAKPAQVVVKECVDGAWRSRTEAITSWSVGGKSGIAFGGARYEVKSLPTGAPVCKGNAHCVRLATVPDGKTDATRTIYLTH